MADASLFIKDLWYPAFHGSFLEKGKLVGKEILGEKIVFGRDGSGHPFAASRQLSSSASATIFRVVSTAKQFNAVTTDGNFLRRRLPKYPGY